MLPALERLDLPIQTEDTNNYLWGVPNFVTPKQGALVPSGSGSGPLTHRA